MSVSDVETPTDNWCYFCLFVCCLFYRLIPIHNIYKSIFSSDKVVNVAFGTSLGFIDCVANNFLHINYNRYEMYIIFTHIFNFTLSNMR